METENNNEWDNLYGRTHDEQIMLFFNDDKNNEIINSHLIKCKRCSKIDLKIYTEKIDNIFYCKLFHREFILKDSKYSHRLLNNSFYTLINGDPFDESLGIKFKLYVKYFNKYYISIKDVYNYCTGCGYRNCRNRHCRGSFNTEDEYILYKRYIANNINDAKLYLFYLYSNNISNHRDNYLENLNITFNGISKFLINKMNNDVFQVILSYI